jgi:arylsulfatase
MLTTRTNETVSEERNPTNMGRREMFLRGTALAATAGLAAGASIRTAQVQAQTNAPASSTRRPNVVMLMTDDTGWNDFGCYSGGGAGLGHPTPNIDRMAKEGAVFTSWYGQASCTAGRASFITGRIPIRSALSIVVAPGDENRLRKETPTIAEFFKQHGYSTYFSGKWHLGDKPDAYPTEHGFDEMRHFAAYYAGVYAYDDTSKFFHPWFPSYNPQYQAMFDSIVNLNEWDGEAGSPARNMGRITYDTLAKFDIRQTDFGGGVHQAARQGRSAVLHGRQLHQDAQPDQRRS